MNYSLDTHYRLGFGKTNQQKSLTPENAEIKHECETIYYSFFCHMVKLFHFPFKNKTSVILVNNTDMIFKSTFFTKHFNLSVITFLKAWNVQWIY